MRLSGCLDIVSCRRQREAFLLNGPRYCWLEDKAVDSENVYLKLVMELPDRILAVALRYVALDRNHSEILAIYENAVD